LSVTEHIDGERLWANLMELAEIGGIAGGGVNRQALSDEEFSARELCISWAEAYGLGIATDDIGNLFFRVEGSEPDLPLVMTGSHIDSQPTGGKFDGAFGVLAGLEAVRAVIDSGVDHKRSIEVVAWLNEEGSRFAPGMMGSEAFVGVRSLDEIKQVKDKNGVSVEDELARLEDRFADLRKLPFGREVFCFVEAHIEQGPILEKEKTPVGAVTGIQGVRRMRVKITGEEAHAGTTPYDLRIDAVQEASRVIEKLYEAFSDIEDIRFTVGMLTIKPNVPSVVASEVLFSIDLRHPSSETLATCEKRIGELVSQSVTNCSADVWCIAEADTITFDENVIGAIEVESQRLNIPCRRIFSGAGHDARQMSYVCPSGMIFVPSCGGISHNVNEHTDQSDIVAGTEVLCATLVELANRLEISSKTESQI